MSLGKVVGAEMKGTGTIKGDHGNFVFTEV
jgi:hypothetical protein